MDQLGIFAKYWQPGAVKTRLAESVGALHAASVYRCCVELLLARHITSADRLVLCITPAARRNEFESIAPERWVIWEQSTGNLGDRMLNYFQDSFALNGTESRNKVVLIGSDCPQLRQHQINEAFNVLDHHDVVLGPTVDGGYYLVGMCARPFDIFTGVEWSTEKVLSQTMEKLNGLGLTHQLLAEHRDLDTWEDLQQIGSSRKNIEVPDSFDQALNEAIQRALEMVAG